MTKDEILACKDAHMIWDAMQENPALKADREVWDHITGLTWQEEQERLKKFFGSEDVDGCHIDYRKKD